MNYVAEGWGWMRDSTLTSYESVTVVFDPHRPSRAFADDRRDLLMMGPGWSAGDPSDRVGQVADHAFAVGLVGVERQVQL